MKKRTTKKLRWRRSISCAQPLRTRGATSQQRSACTKSMWRRSHRRTTHPLPRRGESCTCFASLWSMKASPCPSSRCSWPCVCHVLATNPSILCPCTSKGLAQAWRDYNCSWSCECPIFAMCVPGLHLDGWGASGGYKAVLGNFIYIYIVKTTTPNGMSTFVHVACP